MLYDPSWSKPKYLTGVFSDASLKAWLKEQSGPYIYNHPQNCMLAQYFKSCGFENVQVLRREVSWGPGNARSRFSLPRGWNYIAEGVDIFDSFLASFGFQTTHTFEKALKRAERNL